MKNAVVNLSICLSDIPKEMIKKSDKNGKMYVSVTIKGRKEPDDYGNDTYVIMSQTKEEREQRAGKIYVGQGKYLEFSGSTPDDVSQMPAASQQDYDNLPF